MASPPFKDKKTRISTRGGSRSFRSQWAMFFRQFMKHLVANVQHKHVEMIKVEFRDGRAQMAAQVHAISRVQPQEEIHVWGAGDRWAESGEHGQWTRIHRIPRAFLFNPR